MAPVDAGMLLFVATPILILTALSVYFISAYRESTDDPTVA
ncbi:MAG: hypothetical protein ACOCV2_09070 [Persicimonas sp.]